MLLKNKYKRNVVYLMARFSFHSILFVCFFFETVLASVRVLHSHDTCRFTSSWWIAVVATSSLSIPQLMNDAHHHSCPCMNPHATSLGLLALYPLILLYCIIQWWDIHSIAICRQIMYSMGSLPSSGDWLLDWLIDGSCPVRQCHECGGKAGSGACTGKKQWVHQSGEAGLVACTGKTNPN